MGWFSKKEKEKKVETDVTKKGEEPMIENVVKVNVDKEYLYIVQLNDVEGTTTVRKAPFGAKRYIDGANVYLVNEKIGFKEPFPEDSDEYKQYKIEELDDRIKAIEGRLDDNKKKRLARTPEILDMIQDLKVMRGFKRSLELAGKGSYMQISQEHGGRPLYTFDRKGNFKLPVFKNTDYSLLYVPVEADIALAGDLLKLNEDANGNKDNMIKLANLALTILLIVGFLGLMYFVYETSQTPTVIVEGLADIVSVQAEIADKLQNVTGNFESFVPAEKSPVVTPATTKVNG